MSQLQNNYVFLRLWNSSLWDRYHCLRWILGCCLWFVVVPVLRVAVWQKNVTQGKRCKYVQRTRRHLSKTLKLRWQCVYLAWNFLLSRETWGGGWILYTAWLFKCKNLLLMLWVLYCSTFTAWDATPLVSIGDQMQYVIKRECTLLLFLLVEFL